MNISLPSIEKTEIITLFLEYPFKSSIINYIMSEIKAQKKPAILRMLASVGNPIFY